MLKLYHYTTNERLKGILLSGYLKPSDEFQRTPSPTGKRLKSPIWLSANEEMELAVNKKVVTAVGVTKLDLEQFHRQFGIVRIQIKPSSKVLGIHRLMKAIGLPEDERKAHLNAAIKDGCNPAEWFGIIGKIKSKDFIDVQCYRGKGVWESWVMADAETVSEK